jgi:hypothetical protein
LDVAAGGTNGWFPDGSEKPWLDGSTSQYFFLSLKWEDLMLIIIAIVFVPLFGYNSSHA